LRGATLGLTRQGLGGFDPFVPTPLTVVAAYEHAFAALSAAGATVVDLDALGFNFAGGPGEFEVICFDFRNDLKTYLGNRTGVPIAGGTLQSAIDFNNSHAAHEMPFFNQDIFDLCQSMAPGPDDPQPAFGGFTYNQALEQDRQFAINNVDAALSSQHLDAIVSASTGTTSSSAPRASPRRVAIRSCRSLRRASSARRWGSASLARRSASRH
jgi:hypothetical protein